jgi:hypothetical protein
VLVGALSHSGRIRAVVSDGIDFAHLVACLDGVLRRLGGTTRSWRTDLVVPVATAANRADATGIVESLCVANREVLPAPVAVMDEPIQAI